MRLTNDCRDVERPFVAEPGPKRAAVRTFDDDTSASLRGVLTAANGDDTLVKINA